MTDLMILKNPGAHVLPMFATVITLSGATMLLLAEKVTRFPDASRMDEVSGLFILLIVGVVLLGAAGHAAALSMRDPDPALRFFGHEVLPMSKTAIYFSTLALVAVEITRSGPTRKLNTRRRSGKRH